MRHSFARLDGRGHLNCWLLIGNSRWHWAAQSAGGTRKYLDDSPEAGLARLQAWGDHQLLGWAAVGPVPPQAGLDQNRRLTTKDVPLAGVPPWLGVDRALVGWQAWRSAGATSAVLVADAGTVLSLTRVDRRGQFVGGRLLAGAALQLRALGAGTANLPLLPHGQLILDPDPWPQATMAAMGAGVLRGLAAALNAAVCEMNIPMDNSKGISRGISKGASIDITADTHIDIPTGISIDVPDGGPGMCSLWLTGGDGPLLAPLLKAPRQFWRLDSNLALDALASLTLASLKPSPDL
jgi:type III pantothenate kinase